MTTFIESPTFPHSISYGSAGGPGFNTFVFEGHSGIEQRSIQWSRARARYNVALGIRDKTDMDTVRRFFYELRGKAIGFRFKDWSDYTATDEVLGTSNGITTTYYLKKTYGSTNPYVRRIFKPVSGTVVVKDNGVAKTVTTDYLIDHSTGIITWQSGHVPLTGHTVTASYEFDVPCRFDTDAMSASHDGYLTETWTSIPIVELLLEDA